MTRPLLYTTRARYLDASPEALWNESIRVEHLDLLTPPWLRFEPRLPIPATIEAGTRIDYRLTWHHVPLRWTTEVLEHNSPRHFAYRQARGPYRRFVHHHYFDHDEAGPNGTITTETLEIEVFGGAIGRRLVWPLVRRDLDRLYAFRHAALAARLGAQWSPLS